MSHGGFRSGDGGEDVEAVIENSDLEAHLARAAAAVEAAERVRREEDESRRQNTDRRQRQSGDPPRARGLEAHPSLSFFSPDPEGAAAAAAAAAAAGGGGVALPIVEGAARDGRVSHGCDPACRPRGGSKARGAAASGRGGLLQQLVWLVGRVRRAVWSAAELPAQRPAERPAAPSVAARQRGGRGDARASGAARRVKAELL